MEHSQGNPSAGGEYPASDLLPLFTFGGPETTLGGVSEPNVAVYPGAEEPKVPPYPSGVAGTPGPLSGYCSKEEGENESGSPVSQPAGSTLPFSPYYLPDVVRNADGSLTGYFDYRPKDADEAITVARSTDNGKTWVAEGKALEQNPSYCPTADANDDGQGHPFVANVNSTNTLYTLERSAGDYPGVGLLVHSIGANNSSDPLSGLPGAEPSGIDPNTFATAEAEITPTAGALRRLLAELSDERLGADGHHLHRHDHQPCRRTDRLHDPQRLVDGRPEQRSRAGDGGGQSGRRKNLHRARRAEHTQR